MNARRKLLIVLSILSAVVIGAIVVDVIFFVPQLHSMRVTIDNDRASTALIVQQQSNLDQLAKDLDSIQTKQTELETYVWPFNKEDSFFTGLTNIATAQSVTIDPPSIADATPTGTLIPRAVTLNIHGSLNNVLNTVNAVQQLSPLLFFQQISIKPDTKANVVVVVITASTLWK